MFALDDRCLFEHGKPDHLAEKIDYWLDHTNEKERMSQQYIEYAKQYCIENSAIKLETMFHDAITYYHNLYNNSH